MASVQGFDPAHSGQHPVDDDGNPARFGVWGDSDTGVGVIGTSGVPSDGAAARVFNAGVEGHSIDAPGLYGHSVTNDGVLAQSEHSSGVLGVTFTPAVPGQGPDAHGVFGVSTEGGNGVVGFVGQATGVVGDSVEGDGVQGFSGAGNGVLGESFGSVEAGEIATGVAGISDNGWGVRGISASRDGAAGLTTGEGAGLYGLHFSAETGSGAYGMSVLGSGVEGLSFSRDPDVGGVVGENPQGYAGVFFGKVRITGSLSKGGGGFEIDHPLEPEDKYLRHSFVESPDMLNVYTGSVTTDAGGEAEVRLPDYFEALNSDFTYQLTVVGKFAQAIVSEEISDNAFTIKTEQPGVKVCWQVTGVRKDPWAVANRISVEEPKGAAERGGYLHPECREEAAAEPGHRGRSHKTRDRRLRGIDQLVPKALRPDVRQRLHRILEGRRADPEELRSLILEATREAAGERSTGRRRDGRARLEEQWRQIQERVQRQRNPR